MAGLLVGHASRSSSAAVVVPRRDYQRDFLGRSDEDRTSNAWKSVDCPLTSCPVYHGEEGLCCRHSNRSRRHKRHKRATFACLRGRPCCMIRCKADARCQSSTSSSSIVRASTRSSHGWQAPGSYTRMRRRRRFSWRCIGEGKSGR